MKISHAEVLRVAALASLDLHEDEVGRMAEQLSAILTHMEMLNRLDTSLVEPTFHSVAHEAPFREDVVRPGLGAEEAARGAPALAGRPPGGQFLVPKVIG